MKFQKGIKIFSILLFQCILLLTGGILGLQGGESRLRQEEQAEIVTNIAVVNLDEGVYEESKKVYYSVELMDLEEEIFTPENLEAARQGINNGDYAAYILIPAEFSENAVSINSIPQKSVLEFAMNPNLREDVSRLTMANIKNFEISLNTNMSYMYVQAIMAEFHAVQDSAGVIMENDSAELARIEEIAPEALMEEVELTQIEWQDADIEDVNFGDALNTNLQITSDLQDNYEQFVSKGESAFEAVKMGENVVTQSMDEFYNVLASVDIEVDEDGKVVYEEGLTALDNCLEEYKLQFQEQKEEIAKRVNIEIEQSPETLSGEEDNPVIPALLEEMLTKQLVLVNERIAVTNGANEEQAAEAGKILGEIEEYLNDFEGTDDVDKETLYKYLEDLENLLGNMQKTAEVTAGEVFDAQILKEEFDGLVADIENLPQLDPVVYTSIFEEQVMKPLQEEITAEYSKVQEEGNACVESVNSYLETVEEFDPFEYYDYDKIDGLIADLGNNMMNLEEEVYQTQDEYITYVYDSIDTTNESARTIQEELENAYEGTTENVQRELELAKQYRQQINETNLEILNDFNLKLPYTRIGNLEYTQSYDFMVNPIKLSDTSVSKSRITIFQNHAALKVILLIIIAVWCLSVCGYFFIKVRTESGEHPDED